MNKMKMVLYFVLITIGTGFAVYGAAMFFTFDVYDLRYDIGEDLDSGILYFFEWTIGMGILLLGMVMFVIEFKKGQNEDIKKMKDGDLMEKF